ncbi:formyltransferase family protein [Achromobacter arsenitoxydans]|uniref:Formyltetrahydrofolate dehydrogenase n=1 Tax=Achromobacter arsenitoxydans SY8 TaxID=477184 RepID=H0F9L9_9BURK|nr:formyltransferase family protein [Achromobacter arsenitoxydans]EHK65284.1 Formyltetrahydrofolate dehydrogenase [Achromobacter arsenitoxydans SY8]
MRVMIVGQKWLGAALLRQCIAEGHQVLAVAAPPSVGEEYDRLYATAQQLGVPARAVRGRLVAQDVPPGCDVLLAAHAHCFIDAAARARARHGALGYHPSLLPRHRGRDAIRWAVHMREAVTGGTLYRMDDGADTGPIVSQDWCHVRPGDTPAALWRRDLAPLGLRLFSEALERLARGQELAGLAQDEDLASWEPAFSGARLADTSG